MADYGSVVIDITASQLEEAIKTTIPNLENENRKLLQIPQYVKLNVEWAEESSSVIVSFGSDGNSTDLETTLSGKSENFGNLQNSTLYELRLEQLISENGQIQDWRIGSYLAEQNVSDFRRISLK